MSETMIDINGASMIADRSGALWWPEERLLAVADAVRMKSEAEVLKDNPLLIQKIIAERLSDKVQIMMVPMDGKGFFANDVLKTAAGGSGLSLSMPSGR